MFLIFRGSVASHVYFRSALLLVVSLAALQPTYLPCSLPEPHQLGMFALVTNCLLPESKLFSMI